MSLLFWGSGLLRKTEGGKAGDWQQEGQKVGGSHACELSGRRLICMLPKPNTMSERPSEFSREPSWCHLPVTQRMSGVHPSSNASHPKMNSAQMIAGRRAAGHASRSIGRRRRACHTTASGTSARQEMAAHTTANMGVRRCPGHGVHTHRKRSASAAGPNASSRAP